MKRKGLAFSTFVVISLVAAAFWNVQSSKDQLVPTSSIATQLRTPEANVTSISTEAKPAIVVKTGVGPAYPTTEIATTTNDTQSSLCQQRDEKNCTLRDDIDLSHAFAASETAIDGKKVWLALGSNNFDKLHLLLAKANTSQEALLRQADYQALFNEFYQYAPGLLSNNVTCSDEICAASFSVADYHSIQQISAAMEKFTNHINAHSYSTQGHDSADNLQLKLIFSNSAAFEAVVQ